MLYIPPPPLKESALAGGEYASNATLSINKQKIFFISLTLSHSHLTSDNSILVRGDKGKCVKTLERRGSMAEETAYVDKEGRDGWRSVIRFFRHAGRTP